MISINNLLFVTFLYAQKSDQKRAQRARNQHSLIAQPALWAAHAAFCTLVDSPRGVTLNIENPYSQSHSHRPPKLAIHCRQRDAGGSDKNAGQPGREYPFNRKNNKGQREANKQEDPYKVCFTQLCFVGQMRMV